MQTQSLAKSFQVAHQNTQTSKQAEKYMILLQKLAKTPRYQYFLVTLISVYWLIITFNAMIGAFVFMNPLFKCQNESKTQKQACQMISKCIIENDFTAVVKNKLYCDKLQIRSTIQSIFALGLVIGMIAVPLGGDIFGRRRTIIANFTVGIVGFSILIVAIIYDFQILMIIGSTLTGVFGAGITIIGFILTCDFCPEKMRQRCLLIYCSMWGLGEAAFYLLYFYMNQWDKYLLYTLLIPSGAILIILIYFKIQSPVYAIFNKKDVLLLNQILNSLGNYNKISESQLNQIKRQGRDLIQILREQDSKQLPLKQSIKKIVYNKANLRTCLCLMVPLISFNFFYYGMQGSMQRTGYNFGWSMLLVGLNQFLAYLSASFVTKFIPRKIGAIVSITFTCGIGLLFMLQAVKDNDAAQTAIATLSRGGSVYAYCFILLLQSQLLAVQIRSTAVAFLVSIGQLSRIVVPYIINFFNNLGIHIIIVTSIFFIIFGIPPIFGLRQTYFKEKNHKDVNFKQEDEYVDVLQQKQ